MQSIHLLAKTKYNFTVHESISEIESEWDIFRSKHNIFLSSTYFKVLEDCPPEDLRQRYVLLREKEEIVALFPMQLKLFEAKESILDIDKEDSSHLRKKLASRVRFNTLISGNITMSGEYMHCFVRDGLTPKEQFELTEKVVYAYRDLLALEGHKVNMTFIKDISPEKGLSNLGITTSAYKEFQVEPIMVFYIDKSWKSVDDYLAAMTSKYRIRAKRAFKKLEGITFEECDLEQIELHCDRFYELYQNVLNNVNFSLFKLSKAYFYTMKLHLKDDFRLFAAKDEKGKICGFYTIVHNGPELHAHYLGYDKDANSKHQLYLNQLYRKIIYGIEGKFDYIDFGRTALEIKSSVGAVGLDYSLYLNHRNPLANFFVPSIVSILNKKTEWTPRSPFKSEEVT